jgi:hypothetical protein
VFPLVTRHRRECAASLGKIFETRRITPACCAFGTLYFQVLCGDQVGSSRRQAIQTINHKGKYFRRTRFCLNREGVRLEIDSARDVYWEGPT